MATVKKEKKPSLRQVWLIASTFEPRGASRYTLRLARHLKEYGYDPQIVCESAAHIPEPLRSELAIREISGLTGRFTQPFRTRALLREFADAPPALLHAQRRELYPIAERLAMGLNVPYVLTVHDHASGHHTMEMSPAFARQVIAVSPSVRRNLVAGSGMLEDRVAMIPSGVDIPEHPVLPLFDPRERTLVIGTASALEESKGVTFFLMAAQQIRQAGHDVEFLIAGAGPQEEELRRIAEYLDIAEHVTFAPYIQDFCTALEAIDIFVNPALRQGLGTIMLEAMVQGKPVVATKVGGIADFLQHRVQAMLVPSANHTAIAQTICELLDYPNSARQIAASGQQYVREHFSAERMALQTARLYDAVLADWHAATA